MALIILVGGGRAVRWTEIEARWRAQAEEVIRDMKGWRLQHPKATFKEIETTLDAQLATLRAQMLQDTALTSAATDVTETMQEQRPLCPTCGQHLQAQGQDTRHLTTNHNKTITLTRSYTICPACGAGLFPPR
jgi:ribosomal protein S27AE